MNLSRYPAQEPLSALGEAYRQRILALGNDQSGIEADYGPDPYQSLTVFQPDRPSGEVLVFFHGGGWTNGCKEWMYFMAPALVQKGVTFVSAGYRLAPAQVFPAGFDDCADAIAWVAHHAGRHGGDPGRIFVGGHSAGGHYAALLAVSSAWRSARGLPVDVLKGCLPVSGVYQFGAESGMAVRPRFLGARDPAVPPGDDWAEAAAAPLVQLEPAACPPFLLTRGSRDFTHLIGQADRMAAALAAAGVPVQQEILADCDHFEASIACGQAGGPWVSRAVAWMQAENHEAALRADRP